MGCLLYTDPINLPPEELTIEGPSALSRGVEADFTARAADPDGPEARLRFEWRRAPGKCSAGSGAAEVVGTGAVRKEVGVLNGFCLWAVAIDEHDARSAPQSHEVKGDNGAPVAVLEVAAPGAAAEYPRYTQFRVSAEKSTDPEKDALQYTWTLTPPRGMPAPQVPCTTERDDAICFAASEEGDYTVGVTARDVHGETDAETLTLKVMPDAPPCIELTTPDVIKAPEIFYNPKDKLTLSVVGVSDDGDPHPHPGPIPANVGFRWKHRLKSGAGDAAFTRRFAYTLPYLEIGPDTYQVGDVVEVRVEYRDRKDDRPFSSCDDDKPTCALGPNKQCFQWVTWTINYRL